MIVQRIARSSSLALLSGATTVLVACGGSGPASALLTSPKYEAGGQAKCSVSKSQSEPLIVEWSNEDRTKLEAVARRGTVAVRYQGCEMRVLPNCRGRGAYEYVGTTRKHSLEHITDANDLYAKLPFGAARLEGTLQQSGELNVSMTIVGRYAEAEAGTSAAALVGDCSDATHVITALTVGAFEFSSGAAAQVSGEVSVFDIGARGRSKAERRLLTKDGDAAACDAATTADRAPPEGCGALLRLEVTPLPELKSRLAAEKRARHEVYEDARSSASTRRTLGLLFAGAGILSGAGAGVFAYLGSSQNDAIQEGGFATSQEITDAAEAGSTYNTLAWVFGIAAVPLLGVGIPLYLASADPAEPAITVGAGPSGVRVRGSF